MEWEQVQDNLRRSEFYLYWSGYQCTGLTLWGLLASQPLKLELQSDPTYLLIQPQSLLDTGTWTRSLDSAPLFTPPQLLFSISAPHFILDYHGHSLTVFLANDIFAFLFVFNTFVQMMALNYKSCWWLPWQLSHVRVSFFVRNATSHLNFSTWTYLVILYQLVQNPLFWDSCSTTPLQWSKSLSFSVFLPYLLFMFIVAM